MCVLTMILLSVWLNPTPVFITLLSVDVTVSIVQPPSTRCTPYNWYAILVPLAFPAIGSAVTVSSPAIGSVVTVNHLIDGRKRITLLLVFLCSVCLLPFMLYEEVHVR